MSAVASLDVSSLVTGISDQLPAMAAVGVAILGVYVLLVAYKLLRRVISGDEAGAYGGMSDDESLGESHDYAVDEALAGGVAFSDSSTGEQWGGESPSSGMVDVPAEFDDTPF